MMRDEEIFLKANRAADHIFDKAKDAIADAVEIEEKNLDGQTLSVVIAFVGARLFGALIAVAAKRGHEREMFDKLVPEAWQKCEADARILDTMFQKEAAA